MKAIDIISNLSASKNVTSDAPNIKTVSKSKLGKAVSNATYYLFLLDDDGADTEDAIAEGDL